MTNIRTQHLSAFLFLCFAVCIMGCTECGGVKDDKAQLLESSDAVSTDTSDVLVDENADTLKRDIIGLTASTELYDLYYFDTLSKYDNPVEKVRIDFRNDQEVVSVYPLQRLHYFKDNEVKIVHAKSAGRRKNQHYYIVDTGKEREEQMHLTFYNQGHYLMAKLTAYEISGYSDVHNVVTETVFLDTLGREILHLIREGEVSRVSVSNSGDYAFINSGGWYTEDTFLPYRYALLDIKNDVYLIDKEFSEDCIQGGFMHTKDWLQLNLLLECKLKGMTTILFYDYKLNQWLAFDSSDCVNSLLYKENQGGFVCHSEKYDKQIVIDPETEFKPIDDPMIYINQLK